MTKKELSDNLDGSSGDERNKSEGCRVATIDLKNKLLKRDGKYMFYDNLGTLHSFHKPLSDNY